MAKPASPPPPVMWAWASMKPGVRIRPSRSRSSATIEAGKSRGTSVIAKIFPPPISRVFRPRGCGAYTLALRRMVKPVIVSPTVVMQIQNTRHYSIKNFDTSISEKFFRIQMKSPG